MTTFQIRRKVQSYENVNILYIFPPNKCIFLKYYIVFKSFVRGKYVNRKHELLSIITMSFFMEKNLENAPSFYEKKYYHGNGNGK